MMARDRLNRIALWIVLLAVKVAMIVILVAAIMR